jgi:hypothetical protein
MQLVSKLKVLLDKDPDIVIRTYDEDEDVSILLMRSGDVGDRDYRVSLEIEKVDNEGNTDYQELAVRDNSPEGLNEILDMYFANGGSEESVNEISD